jgi:hypothetical protein
VTFWIGFAFGVLVGFASLLAYALYLKGHPPKDRTVPVRRRASDPE